MAHRSKTVLVFTWTIIFILGIYIIFFGVTNFSKEMCKDAAYKMQERIWAGSLDLSAKMLFPAVNYTSSADGEKSQKISEFFSMYGFLNPFSYEAVMQKQDRQTLGNAVSQEGYDCAISVVSQNIEDDIHANIILEDEAEVNIDTVTSLEEIENEAIRENEEAVSTNAEIAVDNIQEEKEVTGISYDAATLDFDFLMNNFYTVDSTTNITKEQLDASKLLGMDMKMKSDSSSPQILIYHTHSQEEFVDSKKNDSSTMVVGVGDYLAKLLTEKYGFNVIHDTTCYDLIDGKIDRNKAYSLACKNVTKILKDNPSIEVVIDLHRDGIEGDKLVTDINGKQTAKIMFFNGLSYTNKNGKIDYLQNPYIDENLSFSLKLQIEAAKYYPGLMRKIYLKGYRYNLHLKPKSMLVEVGAQNNTLQEELNAMEPLADILSKVLQ